MAGGLTQGMVFLIQVIFGLYGTVIILRLMLRMIRADYYHPLVQAIVKFTKVPVKWLKTVVPDVGAIEMASVVLFLVVDMVKLLLLLCFSGILPNLLGLVVWAAGDFFASVIQLLFYLIIARAILSWFAPNPMIAKLLHALTDPILRPVQKYVPPVGGLDLTPLVAIITMQLVNIIFVAQLIMIGKRLALT